MSNKKKATKPQPKATETVDQPVKAKSSKKSIICAIILLVAIAAVYETTRDTTDYSPYVDEYKEANEAYLEKNKTAKGVVTLDDGLQYKILKKGNGKMPNDSSKIEVNYEGKTIDGNKFDSSYDHNETLSVDMANPGVIQGWTEILKLMPEGSKWEVTIPANLGYGNQDMGNIKPNSTLIFTMEVVSIK